ncbi:hypothetical protein [Bradyrhizobium sp. BR 1432]|uniref:hypothetical protein n=1 Tax=Bradyrhizobium sp. BR 1432 TaxID=3447966 RepID=UPI003EE684F0
MRQRPINGVEPERTEDDITRELLGPRGVPGAPDPARMVPQVEKNTPKHIRWRTPSSGDERGARSRNLVDLVECGEVEQAGTKHHCSELRDAFDCGEPMQKAQKYINIAALIALAGWLGLCFKMGWY